MVYTEFITNLDNNALVLYIIISIVILFVCVYVLKIELGHILALFITIIVLLVLTDVRNTTVADFDKELDFKLNGLPGNGDGVPDKFHLDADLIVFFDNVKQDFYKYNPDNYNKALKYANFVLKICP